MQRILTNCVILFFLKWGYLKIQNTDYYYYSSFKFKRKVAKKLLVRDRTWFPSTITRYWSSESKQIIKGGKLYSLLNINIFRSEKFLPFVFSSCYLIFEDINLFIFSYTLRLSRDILFLTITIVPYGMSKLSRLILFLLVFFLFSYFVFFFFVVNFGENGRCGMFDIDRRIENIRLYTKKIKTSQSIVM